MLQKTSHFMRQANLIGGEWVQADCGQTVDVTNPATGLVIGTVPKSGKAETRRAIEAAHTAFQTWRKTSVLERHKLLRKLHDAIMDNQQSLAELLTMEQGKSLAEAKGEIAISAAYILWFAEEGRRTYGDVVPSPWADRRIIVTKEPTGVIAAITPWNFPSSMLARKIGPALAAGCTAVVKPASQTPYSGLAWGALAEEVGFPEGRGQHRHRFGRRDRRRDLRQSAGQEDHLHRLDRGRQGADPEGVGDRQEGVDGTRRQRALHRLRRRRHRPRGRRRDARQVPQFGPDLRLHQPLLRAGRHLRQVRRKARRRQRQAEGRLGPGGRHAAGSADRREGGREGRGIHRRRQGQGRQRRCRRQAPCARRLVLRADRDRRRDARHDVHEGRDLWARRAGLPLRDRRRGDRDGQRHRVRPRLPISTPAISAAPSASWKG